MNDFSMNYFQILRIALAQAFIDGKFSAEQASAIAQRINAEQANYAGGKRQ